MFDNILLKKHKYPQFSGTSLLFHWHLTHKISVGNAFLKSAKIVYTPKNTCSTDFIFLNKKLI